MRSVEGALELAAVIGTLPGLRLQGVLGYEGHCMLEPDRPLRIEKATAANEVLIGVVDAFEQQGLATEIVAAGGLGTWDITGANPRISEIHAGSYVFTDAFHRTLVPGFDIALTVLATIISRTGDMVVIDVGRKAIGIDRTPPEVVGDQGAIRIEYGQHFIHEEHTALELVPGSQLRRRRPRRADAGLRADDRELLRLLLRGRGRPRGGRLAHSSPATAAPPRASDRRRETADDQTS